MTDIVMDKNTKVNDFHKYADVKPDTKGVYIWRRVLENGIIINFKSNFRHRGAGLKTVCSPEFDHWDGYKVTVPKNLEWRKVEESDKNINIENREIKSCPFCKGQPKLNFATRYIGSTPMDANEFQLKCCIVDTRYNLLERTLEIWNKRNG